MALNLAPFQRAIEHFATHLQPANARGIASARRDIRMRRSVKREWVKPEVKSLEAGKAETGQATEEDGNFTGS